MEQSPTSTSGDEQGVGQPVRGAERNQSLTKESPSEPSLLPDLEPGITLLDIDGGRGVPVIQSLVLDHILMHDGPVCWVDAQGHATTTTMSRLAPSQRLLNRIHVCRGFTAYQHYSAIRDIGPWVREYIRQANGRDRCEGSGSTDAKLTPALIVAPGLDSLYRGADALSTDQARTLQARVLAQLNRYAEGYDVPVLVTRSRADGFSAAIEQQADRKLQCQETSMGPRFVGDEFETLVYPVDGGRYYQTTIAYWNDVLTARAVQVGHSISQTRQHDQTAGSMGQVDPVADALTNLGGH